MGAATLAAISLIACACLVCLCMHGCMRARVQACMCSVCTCVFLTFACHWTRGHDSLRLTMCVRECWRQGNLVYAYMLQPSLGHDVSEIYSLLQHQLSPGAPRLPQHSGKRSLRGQRRNTLKAHTQHTATHHTPRLPHVSPPDSTQNAEAPRLGDGLPGSQRSLASTPRAAALQVI